MVESCIKEIKKENGTEFDTRDLTEYNNVSNFQ